MLSCKRNADIKDSVAVFYGTFTAPQTAVNNLGGMNCVLFVKTVCNRLFALNVFDSCKTLVIAAYYYASFGIHVFENFSLCLKHAVKRT